MSRKFEQSLNELQISLTEEQKEKFVDFYHLLVEWNNVMNLTTITDYEEVNEKHYIDSLSIVKAVDLNRVRNLIDIGTGAGFPGIPLKIVFPHLNVVLLDSLQKRIRFLEAVTEKLQLKNVEAIHGRAEDFARQPEYREQFDLCVSRAVANLSSLTEYCLPYVRQNGIFISYKSGGIDEEVNQSRHATYLLGGKTEKILKFQLPGTEIDRALVVIKKIRHTPKAYPRKAGLPGKEPLR